MTALDGFEKSPVSAASIGAGIGLFIGPVGVIVGALIGGVIDVFVGARAKAKARKRLKRQLYGELLKRYANQIFISALERMASAAQYLQTLGLKPGTEEFDSHMKKLLGSELGYRGRCEVDLYGPAPTGKPRPLLARVDKEGKLTVVDPNVDPALGPKWIEACKELHKVALQSWVEDQKEAILLQREIEQEKRETQQLMTTRFLVNAGVILLILGYTARQKKKLKGLRTESSTA